MPLCHLSRKAASKPKTQAAQMYTHQFDKAHGLRVVQCLQHQRHAAVTSTSTPNPSLLLLLLVQLTVVLLPLKR